MQSINAVAAQRLRDSRAKDTESRRQRVTNAITRLEQAGGELSISAVARAAGVHRSFLHRHPDLAAAVRNATPRTTVNEPDHLRDGSLRAELANTHAAYRRLSGHTRQLETRLSELLGRDAAEAAGIVLPSADTDIASLATRIHELEQLVADLRLELAERTDDLDAARRANRTLIATGNQRP